MVRYETFSYADILPKRVYNYLPESLKIYGTLRDPKLLLILRLLSGTVELTHNYSNTVIKSRVNYFSNDFSILNNWKTKFPIYFSDDVNIDDISMFIEHTRNSNHKFYTSILAEISQFIYHSKKKSHTSAFIYIYRILERISYALPLIYASKTADFLRSYQQLKELMSGDGEKKELGFFKSFINMLYHGENIAETSIDIFFNSADLVVQQQMFTSVKRVIPNEIIHPETVEPDKLSIKYCDMSSFIINIRNRFFHNLNGGAQNIQSDVIVDSDELFSFINPMAMYWLAMVFLQITSFSLSEFQTHCRCTAV